MSTVAEIEAAIEKLPAAEAREVALWLQERQQMLNSSEALFQRYDKEEQAQWSAPTPLNLKLRCPVDDDEWRLLANEPDYIPKHLGRPE